MGNSQKGIDYCSATNLKDLADNFIQKSLSSKKKVEEILKPHFVIVQNRNIRKWLYLEIGKKQGIATNFDFHYFEPGLFQILSDFTPQNQYEYLDTTHFKLFVISALQNISKQKGTNFKRFFSYLHLSDTTKRPDFAPRIYQLSSMLSRYYREYELHYHLTTETSLTKVNQLNSNSKLYEEEMLIYNAIFQKDGLRDKFGKFYGKKLLTLPQLKNEVFSNPSLESNSRYNTITIFALPQVSSFHYDLIQKLSNFYQINVYQINPIYAFEIPKDATAQNIQENKSLLYLWGKPYSDGVEILRNYPNIIPQIKTQSEVKLPKQEKLLSYLQFAIQTKQYDYEISVPQDDSLQILSCPGIYREVETVYQSILTNMNQDKGLKLTDIAILTTDMQKYSSTLLSVFQGKVESNITFNINDSNAKKDSVYGNAVLSILKLSQGEFTRKEVFELIKNPCFIASAGIDREDTDVWLSLVNQLNVFHSFDSKDRSNKGYPSGDIYSWNQAFQRLRLGKMIDTDFIRQDNYFSDFEGIVSYQNFNSLGNGQLGKFFVIVEDLFKRIERLKKESGNWDSKNWKLELESLLGSFLKVPNDYQDEAIICQTLYDSLNYLDIFDTKGNIDISFVIEFLQDCLESIPTSSGNYLTGGITIASLLPLRPIPFKIIYILGLGEGLFPGSEDNSLLNLKPAFRALGDISNPERNTYLFLETLLCAEEKLYLLYNAWDIQKDEEKYPCSVLNQLISFLEENMLKCDFQKVKIPLKPNDPLYFDVSATGEMNHTDVFHVSSFQEKLLYLIEKAPKNFDWKDVENKYSLIITQNKWKQNFVPPVPHNNLSEKTSVGLYELRKFLENPIESKMNRYLGIRSGEEEDVSLAESESFFSDNLTKYQIAMDCINYYIQSVDSKNRNNPSTMELYIESFYKHLTLQSKTPESSFAELEKSNLKKELLQRIFEKELSELLKKLESDSTFYANISLGNPQGKRKKFLMFQAIQLPQWNLEVHGSVSNCFVNKDHIDMLVVTNRKSWDNGMLKFIFEPFLFYLFCLSGFSKELTSLFGKENIHFYISHKDGIQELYYQFSKKEANDYLSELLNDFTQQDSFDTIPFSVFAQEKGLNPNSELDESTYRNQLIEKIETESENSYSFTGFPEYMDLLPINVPVNVKSIIQKRFGKMFSYGS